MLFVLKVVKGALMGRCLQDDIATLAAITTVRPAFGNEALTPETYTAGTAIP